MSDVEIQHFELSDSEDADVTEYRAVSGLAVGALIAGVLAPLALLNPLLWMVPLVGILFSGLALRQIAKETPARVGRKPAVVGLVISVLCIAAAASQWATHRRLVDAEARDFAAYWFEFLRRDEPHKAFELGEFPAARSPLDDRLWDAYAPETEARKAFEAFLSRSEVRTLLALGDQANVRYYDTEDQWHDSGNDLVEQVYAVTYEEAGRKKSFFVAVTLERSEHASTGRAHWRVTATDGGIQPKALQRAQEKGQG